MFTDEIVAKQRAFFSTGATLRVSHRKKALRTLLSAVCKNEELLLCALRDDLGKPRGEAYMCELALVKSEIRHLLCHLGQWQRKKHVPTPLAQAIAQSCTLRVPYGVSLIISPWNYPLLLALEPLADALAAGNTAVIKPSELAPATAEAIRRIIAESFPEEYVTVICGDADISRRLSESAFDFIFFTGSKRVGSQIMKQAAKNLVPVVLELGGKSPCIVDETADIKSAARRIVFGKLINCGQTCVAPDYVYCAESIKERLVREICAQIKLQYDAKSAAHIINRTHFDRLVRLIDEKKTFFGGKSDPDRLVIEPTVIDNADFSDAVMQEEIFGPILPILTFKTIGEAADKINSHDTPLALYFFSNNSKSIRFVTERIRFGGGCINDTLVHLATPYMGFGGAGKSGIGSYHGKRGFEAFSHEKSILRRRTRIDLPIRYRPYTRFKEHLIRIFVG